MGIKKIFYPEIFQGSGSIKNYFEGWYFKVADCKKENVFAVIPGVSIEDSRSASHAFIQVMDGKNASSIYFKFPFSEFSYKNDKFEVQIGNNFFSKEKLVLDLEDGGSSIKGSLFFTRHSFWPRKFLSPGAMGPFSFLPFMECYHGVVSMDHIVTGSFYFNGREMDFNNSRGYIEKDWGRSFPEGWIWAQSNNFESEKISIMLSIAKIPWLKKHFTGFICGFMLKDNFHIFSTYNKSRILDFNYWDNSANVLLKNKTHLLKISISNTKSAILASPKMGAMEGRINESIDAEIVLSLFKLKSKYISKDTADKIFKNEIDYFDNKNKDFANAFSELDLAYKGKGKCSGFELVNPEHLKI